MKRSRALIAIAVLATVVGGACGSGSTAKGTRSLDATAIPRSITVTSPAFRDGAPIPATNTCDGPGTPPAISWTAVPARTRSVAVVVDDPDASTGGPFLHWIVVGLAAAPGHVPTNEAGAAELDNSRGTLGWTPPCPPAGSGTHHYRFSVYALGDFVCADNGDASNGAGCSPPAAAAALSQIKDTALARGLLVGTYRR